jgi:uncharacterized spore protein YtfJ
LVRRERDQEEWIMSLNRLFDSIEQAREMADWRAAFGEPQVVEGKTLIPVAQVGYGFGLGFGSGSPAPEEENAPAPEGGGGGGGASAKPLGTIVVTPDSVQFEPIPDTKIALWGMAVGALFIFECARTVRAIVRK